MCVEDFDTILNHDDYSFFLSLWNNTHVLLSRMNFLICLYLKQSILLKCFGLKEQIHLKA